MQKGNSTALCLWCTLLPECADVHIQQHINRKYLNLCLPLYYYAKVLVELEKKNTKNEFSCVMAMPIRPIFYLKFLESFFEKFWTFLVLYLGSGYMTISCATDGFKSPVTPHAYE